MSEPGFIYLKSYQLSVVICDLTVEFCKRWIPRYSRTYDQMEQAARSGKQNIVEGYLEKSLKSYMYLLGFARASLGELLEDYQDFARQQNIPIWSVEQGRKIRVIGDIREKSTPSNPHIPYLPKDKETAVNLLITLINQASYLLDRQGLALEEKFLKEGGYTENLHRRRLEERMKKG